MIRDAVHAAIVAPRAFLRGVIHFDVENTHTSGRPVDAEAFELARHLTRRLARHEQREAARV